MTGRPESIDRVLEESVDERPGAQAVVGRGGVLTYGELDRRADAAAGGLWELGVRPGERVAASLPNDVDVVIAFHATMRLGAIWVGVAETLAAPEKNRLVQDCAPRVYLCTAQWSQELDRVESGPTVVEVGSGSASESWTELLAASHHPPTVDIDPHAPAGIAYTSGTTGAPKGVVHSQHNLLLPGAVLTTTRGYDPGLRKGDCLPLTILNMLVLSTLLTAQAGGCCVVMDRRDAAGVVGWIRDEELTVWNGVPTQLRDLVSRDDVEPADLAGLEEVWCGGAGLDDSLRAQFRTKFGLNPRATYGLTEVPTVVAIDPPGAQWRPGCSGLTLPHLAIGVRDGELTVSSAQSGPWANQYTPMLGYWNGSALTAAGDVISTGDIGSVDDGWLRVVDRRKLLIVRGGANVYPAEVELVVKSLSGVGDVAVFGMPDERLGQRVAAIVEPDDTGTDQPLTSSQLHDHCAARLAAYKIPEAWATVDALPRNAMGKVLRAQLPAVFASATQLNSASSSDPKLSSQ